MKITLLSLLLLFTTLYVSAQDHVLLSEIGTQSAGNEFIEIYNPTAATIDLSNYFLSDVNDYYLLPGGTPTVISSDFLTHFPPGYVIQPYSTLVIAVSGNDFNTQFGFFAPLQISQVLSTSQNMVNVSTGTSPGLTNVGECVILFYWDGVSDLVQDVDMINVGVPTSANMIMSKSGISVDGPDVGSVTSTYFNDANTIPATTSAPGLNNSLKRIFLENTNEIHGGGNGITGDDETTENTSITWGNATATSNPGTIDFTVGISTLHQIDNGFSIYPNPTSGTFTVSIDKAHDITFTIVDVIGKNIYHQKSNASTSDFQYSLKAGVYFVKIYEGRNEYVKKLIVH